MSNATDNPRIEVLKAGGSGVFTNYIYKAIPLAFDESMSYYETLAGLRDYLEETVIPTVNNNAEAVAELQGLYEELNKYVDDYFKNLDVQEEINNKLDDLVEDGTLTRLIGEYVQPLINEQNQNINEFKAQVNGQIAGQNAQIQAVTSGSPLVASSVQGMTDTTRVYVNTSDGKWYYYNGTQWVAGGVYQATEIDNNSIYPTYLQQNLLENIDYRIPEIEIIDGSFRRFTGLLVEDSSYAYSKPFEVRKDEIVYVRGAGYSTNVMMIAQVDDTNNYLGDMQYTLSTNSNRNEYILKANNNCYMSISYNKNTPVDCYIFKNEDNKKIKEIMSFLQLELVEPNVVWNKYINNTTINSQRGFLYTQPIQLNAGETIRFSARGVSTNVNLLSLVESDGTVLSAIKKSTDNNLIDIEYTAEVDMYVAISCTSDSLSTIIKYKKGNNDNNDNNYNLFTAFNKFGVIGDSLASGESVYWDGTQNVYIDNYDNSWGQYIAKRYGMECINFSKGGLNTRTWLTASEGLQKLIATGNLCKAYIIGLGVNDANKLGSSYLGSANDINLSDYTQNADTFYGNYGKIIGNIKSIQPNAKIFMLTIPDNETVYNDFNIAIRTIAAMFDNVYLIDLKNNYLSYFNSGFIANNLRAGHYNAIAYNYMAELLYNWISAFMKDHYTEFKQIDFISTDNN